MEQLLLNFLESDDNVNYCHISIPYNKYFLSKKLDNMFKFIVKIIHLFKLGKANQNLITYVQ